MKNTRRCPKCGSNDIFVVEGFSGPHGMGNNIQIGATIFSAIPVDRYICSNCGYSEEWIRVEDIQRAKESKRAYKIDQ